MLNLKSMVSYKPKNIKSQSSWYDSSNSEAKNSKVKVEEDRITTQNPVKGSDWNDVGATLKDLDTVIKPKDGLQELPYNNLGQIVQQPDIFKRIF